MKPAPPPLLIAKPCPKSWGEMEGDAKRRFCEHCNLHVHNLSEMSAGERETFVEESGGKACIAYVLRADGTMVTTTWRTRMSAAFRRVGYAIMAVLGTCLPFLFGACAPRAATRTNLGAPYPPKGDHATQACDKKAGTTMMVGEPMPAGKPMIPKPKEEVVLKGRAKAE
jgi:hypothetical protein